MEILGLSEFNWFTDKDISEMQMDSTYNNYLRSPFKKALEQSIAGKLKEPKPKPVVTKPSDKPKEKASWNLHMPTFGLFSGGEASSSATSSSSRRGTSASTSIPPRNNQIPAVLSPEIKVTLVGNTGVGIAHLLQRYIYNNFYVEYVLYRDHGNGSCFRVLNNHNVSFSFNATAGEEDYDRIRPISYTNTNVVIIAFSIIKSATFTAVREKWLPEIRHYLPNIPIVLVGIKSDLKTDPDTLETLRRNGQSIVSQAEIDALKREFHLDSYIEVSSLTGSGVNAAFENAAYAASWNTLQTAATSGIGRP
ncbi:MAG: GTP-binding protein [Gammaproteobacteria bacterium]